MPVLVQVNESVADRRAVVFQLVAIDGVSPANGENDGQPQVSVNFGAWANGGIGTLSLIGNGRYSAILDPSVITSPGTRIETRYKSVNTAECPGDSVLVVSFDPTVSPAADESGRVWVAPDGLDPVTVETGINARQAVALILAEAAGTLDGLGTKNYTFRAAGGTAVRIQGVVSANSRTVILTPPS